MSSEAFIEQGLRSLGFSVTRIAESRNKSPDFLVKDPVHTYLVELKDKFPDAAKLEQRNEVLSRGQTYEEQQSTGYNNAVSAVIRDALKQLAAFKGETVHFKLIWLHARGRKPDIQLDQFRATLYGSVDIVDLAEIVGVEASTVARPCFYFSFSEFYRFRYILDGAIIATDKKALFCLNSLSPRYQGLRHSKLKLIFEHGICDPKELEGDGRAYIADCEGSRRDKQRILKYIQRKYNRPKLIDLTMQDYSAEVLVSQDRYHHFPARCGCYHPHRP